jgi:hypothetical protein
MAMIMKFLRTNNSDIKSSNSFDYSNILLPVNHYIEDNQTPYYLQYSDFDAVSKDICPESPKRQKNKLLCWCLNTEEKIIDLRQPCVPLYNQLNSNSCTANAWCLLYKYHGNIGNDFEPSRRFLYYCERDKTELLKKDGGAYLSSGAFVLYNIGICDEKLCPFICDKLQEKPPQECYDDAKKHKIIDVFQLNQNKRDLIKCLRKNGPFVFCMNVGETFMKNTRNTGKLTVKDKIFTGSHALFCVGYVPKKKVYIIANSWGIQWGKNGYFLLHEDLMHDRQVCYGFYTFAKTINE